MANGRARDGAVQDRINDTVTDAVMRARAMIRDGLVTQQRGVVKVYGAYMTPKNVLDFHIIAPIVSPPAPALAYQSAAFMHSRMARLRDINKVTSFKVRNLLIGDNMKEIQRHMACLKMLADELN
jgi:hypothetical protein